METRKLIYSYATSNRSLEQFVSTLLFFGVHYAVDVRRFPRSKGFPHFNLKPLRDALRRFGICHIHFGKALGGYRRGGYREYMKEALFGRGLRVLKFLAKRAPTCFFCAEADWKHCHRRFIADALLKQNWRVLHIIGPGCVVPHPASLFGNEEDA